MKPGTLVAPRLSVDYAETPTCGCGRCGQLVPDPKSGRTVWREHDDDDRPEMIFVVLCAECADKVIDPHCRLYARLGPNEPAPGVMAICRGCRHQVANRCVSPMARANGGEGLSFPAADIRMFIDATDKRGRRFGCSVREWYAEATTCNGFKQRSTDP